MKIENLTQIENKKNKFVAQFEDGSKINVSVTQIADYNLYSGRELSEVEYAKLREEVQLISPRARAMRILGSRTYSSSEMERRLISKGESSETAKQTVRWLEDTGIVDDEEYAKAIAKYYNAKGYGAARIKNELYRRGIAREMWDDALANLDNTGDTAYDFIEKKLDGSRDKTDIRRATEALCRRGFSYEEARSAVARYLENLDENENIE